MAGSLDGGERTDSASAGGDASKLASVLTVCSGSSTASRLGVLCSSKNSGDFEVSAGGRQTLPRGLASPVTAVELSRVLGSSKANFSSA